MGMLARPLRHAPVHAGAKGFHEVIGEGRATLPGDVGDTKGGIEADAKELLQHSGEQDGVAIVEQGVQAARPCGLS